MNEKDLKGLSTVDSLEVDLKTKQNTLHIRERLDGESFEVYKMRRKVSNMYSPIVGLFWDSDKLGTFRKSNKGNK